MKSSPRRSWWLAAAALCIITLLAYANSFDCGFVLDNHLLLTGSRLHEVTRENLALILKHSYWWPTAETGLYRPVTTLSYLFNYAVLGNTDDPFGYHLINLLLHAGNVLLVFALARRLLRDLRLSFLVAAVWAVHPVLTESVTNIVGRADLLAGMATLGGFLIYLQSAETRAWRHWAWLAALAAVTAAGVFSKESAVALLGVIALYELTWWDRRRLNGIIDGFLAMLPALLVMGWLRAKVLGGAVSTDFPFVDNPIARADFLTGRLTAIKVMAKYLGLLAWPVHLSADYSYAQIALTSGTLTDWIAWILMAALAIGVSFLYRRNKVAFFAAGFGVITLLPAANLLTPVGTIMAERFLYLPAIGFAVCLMLGLDAITRRVKGGATALVVAGLLITAGFGVRTWARNRDWQDGFAFWSAAVQTSPLSFKAHHGFAQQLLQGEHLDIARAFGELERTVAILDTLPDRYNVPKLYNDIAQQYVAMGDRLGAPESVSQYERARVLLLRSLAIHPDPDTSSLLSETDRRLGRPDRK